MYVDDRRQMMLMDGQRLQSQSHAPSIRPETGIQMGEWKKSVHGLANWGIRIWALIRTRDREKKKEIRLNSNLTLSLFRVGGNSLWEDFKTEINHFAKFSDKKLVADSLGAIFTCLSGWWLVGCPQKLIDWRRLSEWVDIREREGVEASIIIWNNWTEFVLVVE